MGRSRVRIIAVLGVSVLALPALAVKTAVWTHEQPKDFSAGKFDNTVVSSLGEVMLGREVKILHEAEQEAEAEVINALARAGDGKIYAATGPNGVIYRVDGDEVAEFATLPDGGSVLSLLFARDGKLLAGSGGGKQAKIYQIDGTGKVSVFYEPEGARYIWAMARGSAGEVYAATGIEGQLHVINADGTGGKVLADVKPKNLLSLAIGADGMLYAGTDEDGLVYRIDPADGKAFVMYDAKEPEISSIVIDAAGNVFAATAAAAAARPGRAIADKPGGKPDKAETRPVRSETAPSIPDESEAKSAATQPEDGKSSSPESQPGNDKAKEDEGSKKNTKKADNDTEKKKPTISATTRRTTVGRSVSRADSKKAGNAIYRIDTDGFVTEVFREPVMILAMVEADGTIYAGTGNEGRIYAITPADDRTTMLAKLEPAQATALLRLPAGPLVIGTANAPTLVRVSDRYAAKGTLISKPLDAAQVVKWGRLKWDASVPEGTKVTIATRSGNVEDEESDAWDDWSAEMDATSPQQISSVSARFLQYRLTFETTVPDATATLRQIQIPRIEENRSPVIRSLEVGSARAEAKKPGAPSKVKAAAGASALGGARGSAPEFHWVVKWKAEDPNKDPLVSDVFYRSVGRTRWVRMVEDTKESLHIWDTRTVADGKYEVRVVAKDIKGNPPGTELTDARISDPIIVDNTPPDATIDEMEPLGADGLAVHAVLTDAGTTIAGASYSVDSDEEWVPLAADDDIFDSPTEAVTFTIDDLEPGEHRVALVVLDQQGNVRFVSRSATIGN